MSTDDEDMDLKRVYSIMKDICKLKREFSKRSQFSSPALPDLKRS